MENLIITTASQQALDLIAKMFIDRGDYVIVGLPSYLGGLSRIQFLWRQHDWYSHGR